MNMSAGPEWRWVRIEGWQSGKLTHSPGRPANHPTFGCGGSSPNTSSYLEVRRSFPGAIGTDFASPGYGRSPRGPGEKNATRSPRFDQRGEAAVCSTGVSRVAPLIDAGPRNRMKAVRQPPAVSLRCGPGRARSALLRLLFREFGPALVKLVFEPGHDARVHLTHAAFREPQRVSDFLHRQFFVVVEDDDQPLVAVEALRHQL